MIKVPPLVSLSRAVTESGTRAVKAREENSLFAADQGRTLSVVDLVVVLLCVIYRSQWKPAGELDWIFGRDLDHLRVPEEADALGALVP